jgi:hypothetical protein
LIILIIRGEEYKSWNFSLCSFLQPPVTSSLFGPNIVCSFKFDFRFVWVRGLSYIRQMSFTISPPYNAFFFPNKCETFKDVVVTYIFLDCWSDRVNIDCWATKLGFQSPTFLFVIFSPCKSSCWKFHGCIKVPGHYSA